MCGIVAAFNNDNTPVNRWIIDQFEDQHNRGMQGFGAIFIDQEKATTVERATEPAKIMVDLQEKINPCPMIVMHHRFPTSTENYLNQTHPMIIQMKELKYDYYIIHNGVISNDKEIKKEHEEKYKYQYYTEYEHFNSSKFNDSEALAVEVALFIEKKTKKVGTIGSAAFIAVQVNKKTGKTKRIFFGRNTSPLNLSATSKKIRLSSEGEGEAIKSEILYSFEPGKTKFTKTKMPFAEREYVPMGYDVETRTTYLNPNKAASYRTNYSDNWDYEGQKDYNIAMTGYEKDEPLEEPIEIIKESTMLDVDQEVEYLLEGWAKDGIGDIETSLAVIKASLESAREDIAKEILEKEALKDELKTITV
jgi:glucosamine 6-phosphate synthetase-like amidotransferase/phosphosugar isomerase protein